MKYECHVTVPVPVSFKARRDLNSIARSHDAHLSAIDQDAKLGKGTKAYITFHENDIGETIARMNRIVSDCRAYQISVIRSKIEAILHDKVYV